MQLHKSCFVQSSLLHTAYSTCPVDGLEAVATSLPSGWVSTANFGTNDAKIGLVSDFEQVVQNVITLEICKRQGSPSRCQPNCAAGL